MVINPVYIPTVRISYEGLDDYSPWPWHVPKLRWPLLTSHYFYTVSECWDVGSSRMGWENDHWKWGLVSRFWLSTSFNHLWRKMFQWTTPVDGRNPKQPLGMYKDPVNNGINYQPQLVFAGFLNHRQYGCLWTSCRCTCSRFCLILNICPSTQSNKKRTWLFRVFCGMKYHPATLGL